MSAASTRTLTVLVLACGGNVGHGILKSLAQSDLKLRVIGADVYVEKCGLYTVDRGYVSPWVDDPGFLDWLIELCREEKVNAIFGSAEPILKLLAKEQERIRKETDAICIVTTAEIFEIGDDKLETSRWLEKHGYPAPAFADSADPDAMAALGKKCGFPLVVKPRTGGGSRGQLRIDRDIELHVLSGRPGYVVQQSVGDEDAEFTVGTFSDREGKLRGTIVMRRAIQHGTTVWVEVGEFPEVRQAAENIVRALRPTGPCNLQFRMHNGVPHCFEFQVRFSGTTPLRTRMGFKEVDAALRHFVLGEPAQDLPRIVEGCVARYWNEMYLDPRAVAALRTAGKLDNPRAYQPYAEDYGVRPCGSS
jgi:carbamoyl-phosphate synthase large subunit